MFTQAHNAEVYAFLTLAGGQIAQSAQYDPGKAPAPSEQDARISPIDQKELDILKNGTWYGPAPYTALDTSANFGKTAQGTVTGNLDNLTADEKKMVNDLINEGKNVEIIPRSNIPGETTPDFYVDGAKTELKTLNGTSLNTPVSRVQQGFKQGADTVIIDGRGTGLSLEQAQHVIKRVEGVYVEGIPGKVEIWTNEGIVYGGK